MRASFVAFTASALNFQALPIRNLAGAALLGFAALTTLSLQKDSVQIAPLPQVATLTPVKIVKLAQPARPAGPSAFQKESVMSTSQRIARWNHLISAASKRFNVPEEWIRAVMRAESAGMTMLSENQRIISSAGAMGLMQVMPDTYAILRAQYGLGADPFDPRDNIFAGTAYLRWLNGRYGYPALFAAYNAGPGRLEQHINIGTQLPMETRLYVGGITRVLNPGQTAGSFGTAKLTQPDGTQISIETKNITAVRAALPGEFAPGVQTVLKIGQRMQGVRETVDAAKTAIRAASLTL